MRSVRYIPRYTVTDYNQWEGDWELIDGIPYAMTPSPTKGHQMVAADLLVALSGLLKKADSCLNCAVVHELDWVIDDTTVLRPDLAIICDETGDYIKKAPRLVVEVLSPATAFKDRQVKFEIYEEQAVPYYLLVDPTTRKLEWFVLENGSFMSKENLVELALQNGCSIKLDGLLK